MLALGTAFLWAMGKTLSLLSVPTITTTNVNQYATKSRRSHYNYKCKINYIYFKVTAQSVANEYDMTPLHQNARLLMGM